MNKEKDIKKVWDMVCAHRFNEAWDYAYEHDIFMSDYFETIDGVDYRIVYVEDDVYKVSLDDLC